MTTNPPTAEADDDGPAGEGSRTSWRVDLIVAAAVGLSGLLFCVLPHRISWARTGDPAWVADLDEVLYLSVASQSYFNHPWSLADPSRAGPAPGAYSRLMMTPGVVLARAFRLGPMAISIFWRAWAGLTIGLGAYAFFRADRRAPVVAAALTLALLGDLGLMHGQTFVRLARVLTQLASGRHDWLAGDFRDIQEYWRIVSPGMVLGSLLLFFALMARALPRPTTGRVVAAGLAFGLLFYGYFYYWSSAGLALLIGLALDAGRRRTYLLVGLIGGLAGLPVLIAGSATKRLAAPGALDRIDTFLKVPRTAGLFVSRPETVVLAACVAWIWLRRRDLRPLAAFAAAGWLLLNHQLVTGLQIQNFHYRSMVYQPATGLMLLLIASSMVPARWAARRAGRLGWIAVGLAFLGSGLTLRALEATRSRAGPTGATTCAPRPAARPTPDRPRRTRPSQATSITPSGRDPRQPAPPLFQTLRHPLQSLRQPGRIPGAGRLECLPARPG